MGLKKNNPGCACCSGPPGVCPQCSGTVPVSVTITLTGWAADYCDTCDFINASFVLSGGDTCDWRYVNWDNSCTAAQPSSSLSIYAHARILLGSGNAGWDVDVNRSVVHYDGGGNFLYYRITNANFVYDSGAASFDCNVARTLTLQSVTYPPDNPCIVEEATCELTI